MLHTVSAFKGSDNQNVCSVTVRYFHPLITHVSFTHLDNIDPELKWHNTKNMNHVTGVKRTRLLAAGRRRIAACGLSLIFRKRLSLLVKLPLEDKVDQLLHPGGPRVQADLPAVRQSGSAQEENKCCALEPLRKR